MTGTFLQSTLSLVSSITSRSSRHRGFKALKQSTKLLFLVLRRPNDALKTYSQLLAYTKSAVTRNYSEKTINGILDYVGGGKGGLVEVDILEKFYQATKDALVEAKNEVRQSRIPSRPRPHLSHSSASLSKPISNWPNCGSIAKSLVACPRFAYFFSSDQCINDISSSL